MTSEQAPNTDTEDASGKPAPAPAAKSPAAATKGADAPEPEEEKAEPIADPATCKAIAIGLDAFWESVHAGEWDNSEYEYYLEPAGILHGPLKCTRAPEDSPQRAGLLMTRAGWKAKKVFLDDDVNPDTYELSFPKEFGYVKPVSHYRPESYEHAKYPWSKKY